MRRQSRGLEDRTSGEAGFRDQPAQRENHEKIGEQMTKWAIRAPRLGASMDALAPREKALLRHLVRAPDHQLRHEHDEKNRCHLKEQREVHAVTDARPEPRDTSRAENA